MAKRKETVPLRAFSCQLLSASSLVTLWVPLPHWQIRRKPSSHQESFLYWIPQGAWEGKLETNPNWYRRNVLAKLIQDLPSGINELLDSHSWSAVKLDLYGLKLFCTNVLNKTWDDIPLVKPSRRTLRQVQRNRNRKQCRQAINILATLILSWSGVKWIYFYL